MGHTKYYNKENIEVPSVTTILKILNKPALISWANSLGFKRINVKNYLNEVAEIGTALHFFAQCEIMGLEPIYGFNRNTMIKVAPLMELFLEWKSKNILEPIFMEKSLSSNTFGGTFDFYGTVNGKLTVLDFKTSKSIYMSMFIQLSGYILLLESLGHKVDQAVVLSISQKGVQEKIISRDELNDYITLFKTLVYLYYKYTNTLSKYEWGESI